jgi:hypothetical protein
VGASGVGIRKIKSYNAKAVNGSDKLLILILVSRTCVMVTPPTSWQKPVIDTQNMPVEDARVTFHYSSFNYLYLNNFVWQKDNFVWHKDNFVCFELCCTLHSTLFVFSVLSYQVISIEDWLDSVSFFYAEILNSKSEFSPIHINWFEIHQKDVVRLTWYWTCSDCFFFAKFLVFIENRKSSDKISCAITVIYVTSYDLCLTWQKA